jgi:radical SAM protein with 4Fe4S-binding SPASM domain
MAPEHPEPVSEAPPLFSRIQIQTVSWCNRSCAFCPSGKFPVDKVFMPVAVYQRLIAQLQALHFAGRISPYLMNEPLLDKRLPELIAYTRQGCPESWIAINTNGDALSESFIHRLFDAGLNSLDVNAYDSTAQHQAHVALVQRVAAQRRDLIYNVGYSDKTFEGQGLARHLHIAHCRDMAFWEARFVTRQATPDLQNRSGNVPGAHRITAPLQLGCPRPFQQMYVNYHGQAILCCNDWRFEVIMGDTAETDLATIWQQPKYQRYRQQLQQKNRALPLCDTCDYLAPATDWD